MIVFHSFVFYIYYKRTLIFSPAILLHMLHVEISTSEEISLTLGTVECMKSKGYNKNS